MVIRDNQSRDNESRLYFNFMLQSGVTLEQKLSKTAEERNMKSWLDINETQVGISVFCIRVVSSFSGSTVSDVMFIRIFSLPV